MKTSKTMQAIITKIAAKHGFDLTKPGGHLKLTMPHYQLLVVEALPGNQVSVTHYYEARRDGAVADRLFKVLGGSMFRIVAEEDKDISICVGDGWSLPRVGEPGDWMPAVYGKLEAYENGYHLCDESTLLAWLGPDIYAVEVNGEILREHGEIVARQVRLLYHYDNWNVRTARMFACDCAEHVVHLGNEILRGALEVVRRYALGLVTDEEFKDAQKAARTAVRKAARAPGRPNEAARWAASAAAWAAESAAMDARLTAQETAKEAARDAARAAGAARVNGWAAERQWQTEHLLQYLDGEIEVDPA